MIDISKFFKKAIDPCAFAYLLVGDEFSFADRLQTSLNCLEQDGKIEKIPAFGKAVLFDRPTSNLVESDAIKKGFCDLGRKPRADEGFRSIRQKLGSQTIQ